VSIELHIERLVIDQALLGAEHPAALRTTVERELARQLGQPAVMDGLLRRGGANDALPWVALPGQRRPHDLGNRIATAAATGLHAGRARLP